MGLHCVEPEHTWSEEKLSEMYVIWSLATPHQLLQQFCYCTALLVEILLETVCVASSQGFLDAFA